MRVNTVSQDPLRCLGPEIFLQVIVSCESIRDITAAEAVHPAWKDVIRAHDRTVWTPKAVRLGLQTKLPTETGDNNTRQLCETFCRRERYWRHGNRTSEPLLHPKDFTAAGPAWQNERTGVHRIKIDEHAGVLYATWRHTSLLTALDLKTSEILYIRQRVPHYAHLEFAEGYAVLTMRGYLQVFRTQQAIDTDLARAEASGDQMEQREPLGRGELRPHVRIDPGLDSNALRLRSRRGSLAPELCTASNTGVTFWDVSTGAQTSHIAFQHDVEMRPSRDGSQPVESTETQTMTYIEFDEDFVFACKTDSVQIYSRRPDALGKVITVTTFSPELIQLIDENREEFDDIQPPATFLFGQDRKTSTDLNMISGNICAHVSDDDLVIADQTGLIVVITDYKTTLRERFAVIDHFGSKRSTLLHDDERVFFLSSPCAWSKLEVQGDFAILQSDYGIYLLPLRQFHTGAIRRGEGRLLALDWGHRDVWQLWDEDGEDYPHTLIQEPSCVQSTSNAVYYVHPFAAKHSNDHHNFDVNVLRFDGGTEVTE